MGGDRDGYVAAMVRREAPVAAMDYVVAGSTPVVAFGDPRIAEIATLGINPSDSEFCNKKGMLPDSGRRLATLASIGAARLSALTNSQVAEVAEDCYGYFRRTDAKGNKTRYSWFNRLDRVLQRAYQVSYDEGSACHLDIVQWATTPIWGRIEDAAARKALLDDGAPHLIEQFKHVNVRLVLVNGRQAMEQVAHLKLASFTRVDTLRVRERDFQLCTGTGSDLRWIGWTVNLQSTPGVDEAFCGDLADRLARLDKPAGRPSTAGADWAVDKAGHLVSGVRVEGKAGLVAALDRWLRESNAGTIGDVERFGGRAWLHAHIGGRHVVVNADTKRAAIAAVVADRGAPGRRWSVTANQRGKINRVLPSSDPVPGWYAYLREPLPAEGTI